MENTTINGYTLKYKLGEGGMAEVWYAENVLGKPAAVKVLQKRLCSVPEVVSRFENEAKLMVQLNHPSIRNIYDFSTIYDCPCMVMEYLEGKDLSQRLKEGETFSNEQLINWWNNLVDALQYTHRKNIIHRDIKPSNLFITEDGGVKVLDFGIAKIKDNITITQTGSRMGTLLYMSPEQVYDTKQLTYKTDIYSLAVTFFHLVTGNTPYGADRLSDFEVQESIVRKIVDTLSLPLPWRIVLPGYLYKNAEDRRDLQKIDHDRPIGDEAAMYSPAPRVPVFTEAEPVVPAYHPLREKSSAWIYLLLSMMVIIGVVVLAGNKDLLNEWMGNRQDEKQVNEVRQPKPENKPVPAMPEPIITEPDTTNTISPDGTIDQVVTSVDTRETETNLKSLINDYYRSRHDCNTLYRFFADTVKQYYRKSNEPIETIIRECENYHNKWKFTEADINNQSYVFTHQQNGNVFVDYNMLYKIKQKETDDWIAYSIDVSMVFDENGKVSRIVETRIEKL